MDDDAGEPPTDDALTAPPPGGRVPGSVYLLPDTDETDSDQAGAEVPGERVPGDDQPSRQPGDDWPWVVEWRAAGEPTPWASGLVLTVFSAVVVAIAVWVLSAGLADRPIVAVLVNVLVAAGLTPAMWLSRDLPVLRWIAGGALIGIVGGWVAAILLLPVPA